MAFTDDLNGEGSLQDRDRSSFTDDGSTGVARKVKITNPSDIAGGLIPGTDFDTINVTYPTTTTEAYSYELSAVVVQTVTITYIDECKLDIVSVVYT